MPKFHNRQLNKDQLNTRPTSNTNTIVCVSLYDSIPNSKMTRGKPTSKMTHTKTSKSISISQSPISYDYRSIQSS